MQKSRPTATVKYITATKDGGLLDVLTAHLTGNNCNTILTSGGVWIGKQRIKDPLHLVKAKETFKVFISPTQGYRYAFSRECILEETDDWMVVFKEPLVTIGMDRSNQYYNLMAGINDYLGYRGKQSVQPITRLDYRVSGVALFSKTKGAERYLFQQMQQKRIKKRYRIVVPGTGYHNWYRVSNRLSSSYKAYTDKHGKIAKTAFVKHDEVGESTIFDVSTQTGRRHQIRYHASQMIGPVLNDELYGSRSNDHHQPIGLIATTLSFHWKGNPIYIQLSNQWINKSIQWMMTSL